MNKVTQLYPRKKEADDEVDWSETLKKIESNLKSLDERLTELTVKYGSEFSKLAASKWDLTPLLHDFVRVFASLVHLADARKLFQAKEVDEFGLDEEFDEKVRPFFSFFFDKYWRVEVKGEKNIPKDGAVLFVGNHSGTLPYDAMMIRLALLRAERRERHARFLVEDFVYHFPFLGMLMYRIGGVRACQENAVRLLEKGEAVLCFPEGVKGLGKYYSDRYRLQRFGRGGFVKLCMKTKAPIVPVAVVGAEEIHPVLFKLNFLARAVGLPYIPITPTFPLLGPLGAVPLPTKWSIEFGEPIEFKAYKESQMEDPILVNRISERIRQKIQGMIAESLKTRVSIW